MNKKCPFCGCDPNLLTGDLDRVYYVVECRKCGIETMQFKTEAEAWAAWNTRPEEDRLNAEIERLKKQITGIYELLEMQGYIVLNSPVVKSGL